ncbi:MAG: hypothetical protein AAFV07_10445, partial [Bacteroidota bacterium]
MLNYFLIRPGAVMGRLHIILPLLLMSIGVSTNLWGQELGGLYWLPEQISSQTLQPAHIHADSAIGRIC